MTNEQVMKIMEELGMHEGGIENWIPDNGWVKVAEKVAEAEREACAKLCDGWTHADGDQCAEAIRARGQG